mmetsp:Transcript_19348/g.21616  ORF Transcript_19348/g.21616 Transcript_19348/m.21616 type:complete len:253 (+) Transcript_19348:126-884(+)
MKFSSSVICLLLTPMFGSAFHASSPSSSKTTCLNGNTEVAKDCYGTVNPLVYNVMDEETGEAKELFDPTEVFTKAATEVDYSKMPINDDQSDEHCVIELIKGRSTMKGVLAYYESVGRWKSKHIVIDTRDSEDIDLTGKFSPNTVNFPLKTIKKDHPFLNCHDDGEWSRLYGFEYPECYEQFIILGKKEEAREAANYIKYNHYGNPKMYLYEGGAEEYFFSTPPNEEEYNAAKERYKKALKEKLDEEDVTFY